MPRRGDARPLKRRARSEAKPAEQAGSSPLAGFAQERARRFQRPGITAAEVTRVFDAASPPLRP
jgi:hypothetical protein